MASVTLSDGTTKTIPDGLSDADAARLTAAIENDNNQQKQPASGGSFFSLTGPGAGSQTPAQMAAAADAATGGKISGAASWLNAKSGGMLAPAANMAGNVAANVAALPWDAPAAITNAITKTARDYGGVFADRPYIEYPMIAPQLKQAFGLTPNTGPVSSRIENALTIASTGGEGLIPRLVKGVTGEALSEGGSLAGQKVAEATDPRLSPLLQVTGAVAANAAPYEQGFSTLLSGLRGKDAGATYDSAVDLQKTINDAGGDLTRPPITTGMVGAPVIKQFERGFGAIPILGQGIESARENAKGMVQGKDISAKQVGATPTDTTATAPGTALKYGTEDYLNNVGQRMDAIENNIANNTQGPGGGAAFMDAHPLINNLDALKWTTDPVTGRVYSPNETGVNNMIDAEIAKVNQNRVPENQDLHTQLVNDLQGLQFAINAPNTPPQQIPALQAQLTQKVGQIDANLKIPFQVARQLKTQAGYAANQSLGQPPTLYDHLAGKNVDAYRDAIQDHVNSLDPQLGAQYQGLNDEYSAASTADRAIANKDEASLTNKLKRGLGAPSAVAPFVNTPVWGEATGNTIRQMGMSTGKFVPKEFADTWDNMTPANKALYTQTHPEAATQLDNVSQLGRNFDIPPETGGMSKSLAMLEVLNKALEGVGLKGALAAMPLGYLGQSMPLIRALAGRPQPYFRSLQENIPALLAVARNQGQTQQGQ